MNNEGIHLNDPDRKSSRLQGVALASAGAIAFSGKAIIVKLAYRYDVDAVTLLMYRMLFALPLFVGLCVYASRGKPALTRRDWLTLIALGFCGYYLASFLDFMGLQYISASLERLILYLNPTFVLVISMLLFKQHVSQRQWLALLASYLGIVVVFGHDVTTSGSHVVLGSLLVLGSAISYALYLLYSGQVVKRLGALRITGISSSVASILCVAQFFLLRPIGALHVAPQVIWLSLLNAIACTFLPVLLVMLAIERVGSNVTAQTGNIGPLSTILLSVLLLGEPFTIWIALGTALVLLGVYLLARWK
ncbi:MAG TPA: DMT family transporter [Steroidobacteraceae bacterium]|nr:DMT family transporter [Steroidobacteraceae bacterium]